MTFFERLRRRVADLMVRFGDLVHEIRARRAGRRHVPNTVAVAARDSLHVAGGRMAVGLRRPGAAYDHIADGHERYARSLDRRR